MARWIALLVCMAACDGPREPHDRSNLPIVNTAPRQDVVAAPVRAVGVSMRACFGPPSPACPSPLVDAARSAERVCRDAGGMLGPTSNAEVWTVDVDADGRREYLFDITAGVFCDGAPGALSCGSLGCPFGLYQRRSNGWRSIGSIDAPDPRVVGVTASGDLRVDCADPGECVEQRFYERAGEHFELSHLMVRGHRVAVTGSPHGLRALSHAADLLDVPAAGGERLGRYPAGTLVAIIGSADGYYYVSPCNACRSGFVEEAAMETLAVGPP